MRFVAVWVALALSGLSGAASAEKFTPFVYNGPEVATSLDQCLSMVRGAADGYNLYCDQNPVSRKGTPCDRNVGHVNRATQMCHEKFAAQTTPATVETPLADATSCVSMSVKRVRTDCVLTMISQCAKRVSCLGGMPTYTGEGRLYSNGRTLHLGPGDEQSFSANGAACGQASIQCRYAEQ